MDYPHHHNHDDFITFIIIRVLLPIRIVLPIGILILIQAIVFPFSKKTVYYMVAKPVCSKQDVDSSTTFVTTFTSTGRTTIMVIRSLLLRFYYLHPRRVLACVIQTLNVPVT